MLLLFTLLLAQFTNAAAQITIGPDKLPVAGDRYLPMPMDTAGVHEGTAGGNKTWDFSSLVSTGPATTIAYVNAAGTPFAQQFPGATLASIIIDGADTTFAYFAAASNKLTYFGSANTNFLSRYTDPEVQMSTPLVYNDQYTDQFRSVSQEDSFETRSGGALAVFNDSYGSITLPGGRASIAARAKFVRQNFDTAFVGGFPLFTSSRTITSYEWFIPTGNFPELQIAYSAHTVNGNTTTSKLVEFNAGMTTGIGDRTQEGVAASFKLDQNFPNPFNPTTTIGFRLADVVVVSLKVYNLTGQEVVTLLNERLPAGIYSVPCDSTGLASGTYLYRLQVGNAMLTKKLTLVKESVYRQ